MGAAAKESLATKVLFSLSLSVLSTVAPLLTFPYISHTLGPERLGTINFIDYTAQFFILFASFGIPMYGAREIAKVRNQPARLKQLTSELVFIHLITSVVALSGYLIFLLFRPALFSESTLLWLAGANIVINGLALDWLIQGLEDFSFLSKRTYSIRLLSVAAVFILIKTGNDYQLYYGVLIITNALLIGTDLIYACKKKAITMVTLPAIKQHLQPLVIFFLTTATLSFYTYFDTIILGIVSGSLAVAFYTTGIKIIRLSQNFVNDLGGVLLPRISFLKETNNTADIARLLNKSLKYVLTVSVPLAALFLLLAPEIINLVAGAAFMPTVSSLRILSVMPVAIGLHHFFNFQILLPFKKEKRILVTILTGSLCSVILNVMLCARFQQAGAAAAAVLVELIITGIAAYYALKEVYLDISSRYILHILISAFAFWPVIYLIRYTFDAVWIILTGSFLACGLVYFLLQHYLFKNEIVGSLKQYAIRLIRPLKSDDSPASHQNS